MTDKIDEFLIEYREAIRAHEHAKAESERRDEARRNTLSGLIAKSELPVSKAEHVARASAIYQAACNGVAEARTIAADAKAHAEWMIARFEAWRTRNATERAKMRETR